VRALSVTIYHLLTLPSCIRKLKTELEAMILDSLLAVPLSALDVLPYPTMLTHVLRKVN
jgi:hypothetical protein